MKLNDSRLKVHNEDKEIMEVEFSFNNGANEGDILRVENEINRDLPNTLKILLKYCDGCRLYNYENLGGFQVLSTQEICKVNSYLKNTYGEDWDNELIVFCKYIGEDDYLAFKYDKLSCEYNIVDCFTQEIPREWEVIACNLN